MFHLKARYLFPAVLTLAAMPALAAPPQPNAGQTIRQIEQMPAASTPQEAPAVTLKNETAVTPPPGSNASIPVKAIHITGNTVFTEAQLEPLVADLAGGRHTLAELDKGAQAITRYYHQHGYIVARAYIPAQKIKDGVITIRVLEGIVGKQTLENTSRLSDGRAEAYIAHAVVPGDVLHSEPVDRSLLLLADTPGVGGAHSILRPGASVGTTDLLVKLDPAKAYDASLSLNNFGNRYTGQYLADGSVSYNNPLHIGDQLSLRGLASDNHLLYGRAAYQAPVGYSGLRMGVAYADTGYQLGKEFDSLGAHGTAQDASVYAIYPFLRTLTRNLYGTVTLEDKRLQDYTNTPASESEKKVDNLDLGLSGNYQDKFLGGGVSAFSADLIHGNLGMDAAAGTIDSTTAQAAGGFTRFTYDLSRLQQLTPHNLLWANLSGQRASKNLNSSEQMTLGGIGGVRAYSEDEGDGDQGWLGNLELRHNLEPLPYIPQLQLVAFYDAGSVDINRSPYTTGENKRTLSGAGLGLNATVTGGLEFKSYVAWRLSGTPTSEPSDHDPRLWLQLTEQF